MPQNRQAEAGNVFMFILLGVVLFAALAFTVSRGFRSDTTSAMSARQAELAATDILNYAQRMERAVNRLRRKGTSESDISFDDVALTGFNHTPAVADNDKVFDASGGNIRYSPPVANANDGSDWHFTGRTCIAGIGSGASGCDSDADTSNEELLMVLRNVNQSVCEEINGSLDIAGVPTDTGGGASTNQYQGSFADGTEIILAGGPFSAACFTDGTNNHFYFVLLAR